MGRILGILLIILGLGLIAFMVYRYLSKDDVLTQHKVQVQDLPFEQENIVVPEPEVSASPSIPIQKILQNDYHIFQSFNNCGPAALSMALSYYGVNISQQELGAQLRPYQNATGDNDDKSTTLEEMAKKAEELGFTAYHRPNGNFELMSAFIANDMPVVTRTWLKPNDDIGHYRVAKGYDTTAQTILQDDSLQGANLTYTVDEFNSIWKQFGYEYLVLVPKDKEEVAKQILGEDVDTDKAWAKSLEYWKTVVAENPSDSHSRFNLSIAYYMNGKYLESVAEFEQVEDELPFRTLWYQIEPILAYKKLGNYGRVFEITDKILNNNNRAFSELYLIRGDIYKEQGNLDAARAEYEQAVFYNSELDEAKEALESL